MDARQILDELEAFSAKCWDRADDGALMILNPKYIARYDELCRLARIELGRPLLGDLGELD